MSDTLSHIEAATGAAQAVGGYIAGQFGGPLGQAAATFLLGEAAWTASAVDLAAKLQDGTATGLDVADLSAKTASTLAGFGVLAGLASPVYLTAAGVAGGAYFFYKMVPEEVRQDMWNGFFEAMTENPFFQAEPIPWGAVITNDPNWRPRIGSPVNTAYLAARGFTLKDPLALDLDGDGIETVGVNANILFDHDGDGIKTGTGWLKGDDGFLVLDRNGNGSIDSGAELFGADTVLANGAVGVDGFTALSDLDTNGDRVFDAADARFADVRVWRDLNQDGISQGNELFATASLGITAIDLVGHTATKTLAGGNVQTLAANVAGLDGPAVNLNLDQNPFYSAFTDSVPLTAQTATLPDMQGSGSVRSLREAATLNPELAASLAGLQTGYLTRDQLLARMDDLLTAWAATSLIDPSTNWGPGYYMSKEQWTYGLLVINSHFSLSPADRLIQQAQDARRPQLLQRIATLERFNGQTFITRHADGTLDLGNGTPVRTVQIASNDGSSQTGELKTLAQQDIKAIRLAATASGQILATQNQIAYTGLFDKTNGTTGTAVALNLADNPFFRQYPDGSLVTDANPFESANAPIPLSPAAQNLPDMQGAGAVRDLQEAASLDPAFGQNLQGLIDTGIQSRQQLWSRMDSLVEQWAGTSGFKTSIQQAQEQGLVLHYLPPGIGGAKDLYAVYGILTIGGNTGSDGSTGIGDIDLAAEKVRIDALKAEGQRLERIVGILERYNGITFVDVSALGVTRGNGQFVEEMEFVSSSGSDGGGIPMPSPYVLPSLDKYQVEQLDRSYAELRQSLYDGLALQTRLKPYLDDVTLTIDASGIRLDAGAMEARLAALHAADPAAGFVDALELRKYMPRINWNAEEMLVAWALEGGKLDTPSNDYSWREVA